MAPAEDRDIGDPANVAAACGQPTEAMVTGYGSWRTTRRGCGATELSEVVPPPAVRGPVHKPTGKFRPRNDGCCRGGCVRGRRRPFAPCCHHEDCDENASPQRAFVLNSHGFVGQPSATSIAA